MPYNLTQIRVLRAPPERVYRALLDPAALAKWNAPDGFTAIVHELDARVGGRFRMSFVNFSNGQAHSFGGEYRELVPHERIVATDVFENPGLPGEIVTTYTLRAVGCGTELIAEQAGLPDVIPADACRLGWQQSLDLLARLVEPEIPAE
ncbi:MAG: SRPBCC family protein [Burkholderiaceae bacterium]